MIITEKGSLEVVSTNSPEDLIDFFKTHADEKWLLCVLANVLETEEMCEKKVWAMTKEQLIKELDKTLCSGLDDLIDHYFEDFDDFDTWEEDDWMTSASPKEDYTTHNIEVTFKRRAING